MEISADEAYWLLTYYRNRATRLHVGGRISGEDAACEAVVTEVDRPLHLVAIELLDTQARTSYQRVVPLQDATFTLYLLGKDQFEPWMARRWHSVLLLMYPDSMSIFFAEGKV
jgi:hypothetical protein